MYVILLNKGDIFTFIFSSITCTQYYIYSKFLIAMSIFCFSLPHSYDMQRLLTALLLVKLDKKLGKFDIYHVDIS